MHTTFRSKNCYVHLKNVTLSNIFISLVSQINIFRHPPSNASYNSRQYDDSSTHHRSGSITRRPTFCTPPKRALSSLLAWFTSIWLFPAMSCMVMEAVMMGAIPVLRRNEGKRPIESCNDREGKLGVTPGKFPETRGNLCFLSPQGH